MGKSESTPSALWTIMPVMPIMAARPLLRSALSLNFFTSGSSYLGSGQTDQLRAACRPVQSSSAWQRGLALLRVLHHETVPPHTVGQGWREAEPQANQQAGRTERGTAGAQTGGLCAEPARQLLRQAAHLTQVMPPTSPGSLDGSVAP